MQVPGVLTCSEAWAECLRDAGFEVNSGDVAEASGETTTIIVAPHAALRPLADDPVRQAGILRRSVCVSTSRLGSGALGADRPFHQAASASVALSRDSSQYLTAFGVPTAHLKPGGHARLRSSVAAERDAIVGTHARYSRFREDLLARSRDVLDPHRCDLRISHSPADQPPAHLDPISWRIWLASIDVFISLPPEPGPGLEWCEVAPAAANGAVVLTTAESDFAPLEPGEDIAIATTAGFSDALRRLLGDDERRDRMRDAARAHLTATPLDVTPLAEAILLVEGAGRRVRPLVASGDFPAARLPAPAADSAAAFAAAKAARARRAALVTGGADRTTTTTAWAATSPAVSVVIPSFAQAEFVTSAVESALAAVGVELEVIVIDDCSPDASTGIVTELMRKHDGRALKLVELADNAGVSAARNRGFLEARAPLILLLDADDLLLPHGLVALHEELAPDAAFAYGLLARFGTDFEDFQGTEPWDPMLFRHGNYVPLSCSLIRHSAWELVGGYTADGLLELGWEDMDFWLRLADAGQHATHVRRIVGAYRVRAGSMTAIADAHAPALMAFMRERHPHLLGTDDA